MTNLTNEEMLAKALADELRPWLERIKQLETENAVQHRRIELLEILNVDLKAEVKAMSYREKRVDTLDIGSPWRPPPKIAGRSRSIKLGH